MLALLDATIARAWPETLVEQAEALRDRFEARSLLIVIDSLQVWARGFGATDAVPERMPRQPRRKYQLVTRAIDTAGRIGSVSPALCLRSPTATAQARKREGCTPERGPATSITRGKACWSWRPAKAARCAP